MMSTRATVVCCLLLMSAARAETFLVNTPRDTHDAILGDGVAADFFAPDSLACSMRAAIEEANALPGRDTVLVPDSYGPIKLHLGSLILEDSGTIIAGYNGRPVLDGVGNPTNHATFIIYSDSCKITGFIIQRSRGRAIDVFGSDNSLGGSGTGEGLVLIGNSLDDSSGCGVRFAGDEATRNTLEGSYVGIASDGITSWSNPHGVVLDFGASFNRIGGATSSSRNIISGNTGWGVVISGGSKSNEITGSFIGPDSTGDAGPGNALGGVLLDTYATGNRIGTNDITLGNVISANLGPGVSLSGGEVYGNFVDGNLIGSTASGELPLPNWGDGVLINDGAHSNSIGTASPNAGNLISGNGCSGIHLTGNGVSRNTISANWIGISLDGYRSMGNCLLSGAGVFIESGSENNIVGGSEAAARNVISANYGWGVSIDGTGTANNVVRGNYIGLNAAGTSSLGNSVGVGISGSAEYNVIGGSDPASGNVISGNRGDEFPFGTGVLIYGAGTRFNNVMANYIGLDKDGMLARRNGNCGIIIGGGAQYNFVGGTSVDNGNIISGNGVDDPVPGRAAGIHIFGASTAWNRFEGNAIGLGADLKTRIANRGHGIGIFSGAHHNSIGGNAPSQGNYIAASEGAGVLISGSETQKNLIRYNLMLENDGLGIALEDSAQQSIFPPVLTQVGRLDTYGPRLVAGRDAPPGARIDIYQVAFPPDPSGSGEGLWLLGYTYSGSNGRFEFYLPAGPAMPIILTAVSSDAEGNSSEFSPNGYSPDAVEVEDSEELQPHDFALSQNFPNPFNGTTSIIFSLPNKAEITLTVHNVLGQRVKTLAEGFFPSGQHEFVWDGTDEYGLDVASGVYFYRLCSEDQRATRKMVLLK